MKKIHFLPTIFGILAVLLLFSDSIAQRSRRADSVDKFFIGTAGGFDSWPYVWWTTNPADSAIRNARSIFGPLSCDTCQFKNFNDTLNLNAEVRNFWDYPSSSPTPPSIVLGGGREPYLDVLIIEPHQLFEAFNDAAYMRFEFERHTQLHDSIEYPGFLDHPGVVGRNDSIDGTSPLYLAGTSRQTPFKSLKLEVGIDSPGVFNDSLWHRGFVSSGHTPSYYFRGNEQKKLLFKMRMRADTVQSISVSSTDTVLRMTISEFDGNDVFIKSRKIGFRLSKFVHRNSDFDTLVFGNGTGTGVGSTYSNQFFRDASTRNISLSFEWEGNVNLTADYLEVMTAHINGGLTVSDNPYDSIDRKGYGYIERGETAANSGDDFTRSSPTNLLELIDSIIVRYSPDTNNHYVNYIRIGDEFGLGQSLPFKRLVKLFRQRSGGRIEVVPYVMDSTSVGLNNGVICDNCGYGPYLGGKMGIPSIYQYTYEGARLGWVDTSLYADPKYVFFDPYPYQKGIPLPKRTTHTDPDSISAWEDSFAATNGDSGVVIIPFTDHYSRDAYTSKIQNCAMKYYLRALRTSHRWELRNQLNKSKYGILWQAGVSPERVNRDTGFRGINALRYSVCLRPPTGAEMQLGGHLATSCGASGLLLYLLSNSEEYKDGWNGGIMSSKGDHSSNTHTFSIIGKYDTTVQTMWMGWKERFDMCVNLFPTLKEYGTILLHSKYIGDWRASELFLIQDSTIKAMIPFKDSSIVTMDDTLLKDVFSPDFGIDIPDTANRTFVHISMWIDTVGGASDTLLYITNMRTDDSYDTTEVPTTIDRRLITMKMKAPHIIEDVAFPQGAQLDNEKIWTPYVGTQTGDSLKLFLKAGDGILIRLADTSQGTMRQTRIAINYPKNGSDFNDHGRVVFNRPVPGVLDKTNSAKWSIPSSSRPYIVGIPDTTTAKMWQDSLLYRTVNSTRIGRWRHQNWTEKISGGDVKEFDFQKQLGTSTVRNPHFSTDSLAHNIVIKTEFEDNTTGGKIKFYDPFFVDSTTLLNKYGDSSKTSPFLPQTVDTSGAIQGGHHEKYGGIFLAQNYTRDTFDPKPMYSIDAYQTILPGATIFNDAPTSYAQWGFLQWTKNDYLHSLDPTPWINDTIARKVDVVFMRDSAIYTARYKAHMAAFESGGGVDSGMCCNNQRKLYFEGLDSIGRSVYRAVYNSYDRIYTALGTKTGPNNADFVWQPEELLSEWNDPRFRYPALGRHSAQPIKYHFVYQDDWGSIVLARIDTNHVLDTAFLSNSLSTDHAVPAIASTDVPWGPIDVVAWEEGNSIRVKAMGNWEATGLSDEVQFGDYTAHFPTLWMDSCYDCNVGNSKVKFWLAYQKDTLIFNPAPTMVTDIFAVKCEVQYGSTNRKPDIVVNGNPFSVSRLLTPASNANIRPCLSGMRIDTSGTTHVKLAYEALHGPSVGVQGINIANNINFGGWTNTHYITSFNSSNKFWKPSIEVTKLQKNGSTYTPRLNWYSVVHERNNGTNIQHWAFDSATQRLTSHIFTGLQDPQIAVTPAKIDSHIYRIALNRGSSEPRWIIPGYTGTYKLGANDTLWGYHTVTERDTSGMLYVNYGFGELGVEDENGLIEFDLKDRDESEVIDSAHSADYFMRSEPFTLPASSSFQYCPWVYVSSDSIFRSEFDTVKFVLDFYDTTGTYVCRMDSFEITDSLLTVSSDLRQISIDRESNLTGFVVFSRISGVLPDTGKVWNSIISESKLSVETAYKRAGRKYQNETDNGIILTAIPNPFTDALTLKFSIPNSGPVTIEVFDGMGKTVGFVSETRFYGYGTHTVDWNPKGISKGVYTFKLTFGNNVETVKAVYVE